MLVQFQKEDIWATEVDYRLFSLFKKFRYTELHLKPIIQKKVIF